MKKTEMTNQTIPGMEFQETDDILVHFGVRGMKWGIRRNRNSSGSRVSSVKGKIKSAVGKIKNREKIKNLSDEDIKKRIARLQLEKQYRDLKSDRLSVGSKWAQKVIAETGTQIAKDIVRYGIGTGVNTITGTQIIKGAGGKKKKK